MQILIYSISIVAIAIFLHLILLKMQQTAFVNAIVLIIFVFSLTLCAGFIIGALINKTIFFLPGGLWGILQVAIFYIPVMLSYVITYVALEDDSPSMTIVRFVDLSKEKGRSRKEIEQIITNEILILPRINIMLKDGWINYQNRKYQVTKKGRFYNQFFAFGLKLLRITREG
jgi:hypothetical protein